MQFTRVFAIATVIVAGLVAAAPARQSGDLKDGSGDWNTKGIARPGEEAKRNGDKQGPGDWQVRGARRNDDDEHGDWEVKRECPDMKCGDWDIRA